VNSLETGLVVARVLAENASPQTLKGIAARAGMHPAKAHRYLVSLIRSGFAEQVPGNGRYRLGPLALHFGLGALRGLDVLRLGSEAVAQLRAETDETVMLAVWGNRGPVIVQWEESTRRPIATNVHAGWVMPLVNSATGRVFAAYLPGALTEPLLQEELTSRPDARAGFSTALKQVRARGLSRVEGELMHGVAGVAAPVFGINSKIVAVLALIGNQGTLDVTWDGPAAKAVKQAADALSRRLGFKGEEQ
jgi:DNA-binding IclR family transcriptional regulator